MLYLYYVDYEPGDHNHGLSTYTEQYILGMSNRPNIKLTCIWLGSVIYTRLTKKSKGNVTYIHVPKQDSKFISDNENIANIILREANDLEGIIIHLNWINHCAIAQLLKWKLNCSIVLTKHCIPWRDLITNDYQKFKKINRIFTDKGQAPYLDNSLSEERHNYKYIDHIITVTKFAKQSLTTLFEINKHKISIIYNGLFYEDKNHEYKKIRYLRHEYGFNEDDKIILFAGSINTRKGILDLIEAFRKLLEVDGFENTKLIIAGNGNHSLIFRYFKTLPKIVITGNLPKQRLYDYYRLADVGVVPSYIEQCSYTAIEMMHFKLPIIVSYVDGLREIVKNNCGAFVKLRLPANGTPSLDKNDLKRKLEFLLKNREERLLLANNAYLNAIDEFSLSKMINKTVSVYDKLIREQSKAKTSFSSHFENILVSILIPVFNAQDYIAESINSILSQIHKNFEIIIINDASTDHTLSVIKKNTDSRIKVINNRRNMGIAYSLNKGISLCQGKYIARLDADDVMLESRLKEQIDFLEQNPEHAMVGSWYELIDRLGNRINIAKPPTQDADLKLLLLFANQFAHPTMMIRTEVLKEIKYTSKYKYCEDYELWFKVGDYYKVANLPVILTKYRIHSLNTSQQYSKVQQENTIRLIAHRFDKLKIKYSVDDIKIHSAITFGLGSTYFRLNNNMFKLIQWLDKLFKSPLLAEKYTIKQRTEIQDYVMKNLSLGK